MKMKKTLLMLLVALFVAGGTYAQKNKRTSAYNDNKEFDSEIELYKLKKNPKDLEKAQEAIKEAKANIDAAVQNEKTKIDPKTWLYAGAIYYNLASLPMIIDEKAHLDREAAKKAYEALLEAKKLDEKNKYVDDINVYLQNLYNLYFTEGANNFNDQDYNLAKKNLKRAFDIMQHRGVFDTVAAFYTGLVSYMDKDPVTTIEYMKKCDETDFKDPRIYIYWNRALKMKGDTVAALEVIEKGRKKYPEELSILLEEAQTYLEKGETEKLKQSLLKAIEKDTANANLYFLLGKTYDDDGDKELAEVYYKKAIKAKPDFFEAYYNIGAIYNNKAAELMKEAGDLPLEENDKYNKLMDEATENLDKAVPWLEKALELNPEDKFTRHALKEAYTRLKKYDKAKALDE
jgi:tetratricopeptide (TPR) repeat protein